MKIPLFRPTIKRREMDAVLSSLVGDNIGSGDLSKRLGEAVCGYTGCEYGVAFRENQRALACILLAMELEPGSTVIISPLAPAFYLDVLLSLQLRPLYCDIAEGECVISSEHVEKLLDFHPKAVIAETTLGFVPDLEGIADLGIPLIEDISRGIGSNTGKAKAGSFGAYTLVSLEQDCMITAGGGCLVLCRGRREKISLTRILESIDTATLLLPDMNCSLGIQQIGTLEGRIQKRKDIAQVYAQAAAKTAHQTFLQPGEGENIHYAFPLLLSTGMKDVIRYAGKKGIETAAAFEHSALINMQIDETPCPTAHSTVLRCVLFPLYPLLGKQQIETIARVISTLP